MAGRQAPVNVLRFRVLRPETPDEISASIIADSSTSTR